MFIYVPVTLRCNQEQCLYVTANNDIYTFFYAIPYGNFRKDEEENIYQLYKLIPHRLVFVVEGHIINTLTYIYIFWFIKAYFKKEEHLKVFSCGKIFFNKLRNVVLLFY